jgi:hypothetical protein
MLASSERMKMAITMLTMLSPMTPHRAFLAGRRQTP